MTKLMDIRDRLLSYAATPGSEEDSSSENVLEIPTTPEELAALSDDDLEALTTRASEEFDSLYGDGSDIDAETYEVLAQLTPSIQALAAERVRRDEETAERTANAAELARLANPGKYDVVVAGASLDDVSDLEATSDEEELDAEADELDADVDEDGTPSDDEDGPRTGAGTGTGNSLVASSNAVHVPPARTRGRVQLPVKKARPSGGRKPGEKVLSMKDFAFATTDLAGYGKGQEIDWEDAGRILDKRLASFNPTAYANAAARGQHMREQGNIMAFRRNIPAELMVSGEDGSDAIAHAIDMSRLPGNSLVAAGWCAPSEVLYDLCAPESRDGLLSLPEVGISRGGVKYPVDPTFASIYNAAAFFHFTEEDAADGKYAPGENPGDPNVVGPKPCFEVPCPTWDEKRLEGDGVCITGDIIQQRGYPEALARYMSGILVAHDHRISARQIAQIVAGSTAIAMTTGTTGTAAPLLAAIELQVEHYRYTNRLARSETLEAILPYWIHGAIRQDLSVRLGIDLLAVTNTQIDAWFALRGIVPQYVYDWQAVDATAATGFVTWPATVQIIIYRAGTWVRGVDDIITMDNVYDSTQLGLNKFTALFTEESYLLMKRCTDSRVLTVPVCSDGTTNAGLELGCDLVPAAAPVEP